MQVGAVTLNHIPKPKKAAAHLEIMKLRGAHTEIATDENGLYETTDKLGSDKWGMTCN